MNRAAAPHDECYKYDATTKPAMTTITRAIQSAPTILMPFSFGNLIQPRENQEYKIITLRGNTIHQNNN